MHLADILNDCATRGHALAKARIVWQNPPADQTDCSDDAEALAQAEVDFDEIVSFLAAETGVGDAPNERLKRLYRAALLVAQDALDEGADENTPRIAAELFELAAKET